MSKVVWETVISDSTFVPRHLSMPADCGDGLSDVGGCLLSILSRLPPSQSQVLKKTAPSPPPTPTPRKIHYPFPSDYIPAWEAPPHPDRLETSRTKPSQAYFRSQS